MLKMFMTLVALSIELKKDGEDVRWVLSRDGCIVARVVISAGRNYFYRPAGRNWLKLAETGLNRQKLAEIKNLKLMG